MDTNDTNVEVTPTQNSNNVDSTQVEETKVDETMESEKEVVIETPEAKRARLERQLNQHNKKYGFDKEEKLAPKTKKADKNGELDYGQKAYLVANGIKGSDEVALVQKVMAETGRDLDSVLEMKHFQTELKDFREAKALKDAIPNAQNRSGQSTRDQVGYWIAKGELPPADQVQLRRDVLNKRIEQAKSGNQFSSNPIVQN